MVKILQLQKDKDAETRRPPIVKDKKERPQQKEKTSITEFLKKITPVSIFPNTNIAAWFWFWGFWVLLVLFASSTIVEKYQIGNRQWAVILTPNEKYVIAPLIPFNEAVPIHESIAKLATRALLNRNPNGFDEAKLLKQLYTEKMYDFIEKDSQKSRDKFARYDIHQKCEIHSISELSKSQGYIMSQIKGQLIRFGKFKGQPSIDSYTFTLNIRMVKNPNLGLNMRLPYIVDWLSMNIKKEENKAL